MTPEERRAKNRETKRRAYRRARGIPEDAVLRLSPEEQAEKERTKKREWYRKKRGSVPKAEYLAKLAAKRAEKEFAKEVAKLARIKERAIQDARKAEEREARKCQTFTRFGNGKTQKSASPSPAVTVRKPGRLVAMCGWNGW